MLQVVEGNPLLVRIVDFGLAKFTEERTSSSKAMGTPAYMAPEQLLQRDLGPWTDLYAVGVVAFGLLTGRRPYPGRTSQEIIAKKVDPAYDPLERIIDVPLPELVRAFLRRALARDTAERFRTGQAFREALEKAMEAYDEGVEGTTEPLDVSGLLDSSDLVRVGAEKRKLEEEKRRLAAEKAALDEERRRLDEERRALAATGPRSRPVPAVEAGATARLDEVPGGVGNSAVFDDAPVVTRSRAGYWIGGLALLASTALAAFTWAWPASSPEHEATRNDEPVATDAAPPVAIPPRAVTPEPVPTPSPDPGPMSAPEPAPVASPTPIPEPAPVAAPAPTPALAAEPNPSPAPEAVPAPAPSPVPTLTPAEKRGARSAT